MKNFGRLVELHRLLLARRGGLTAAEMGVQLQCSRATVMRLLSELRDVTCDPIPYDRDRGGYSYQDPDRQRNGLPSLWFNSADLYALLVIRHQLRQMQPGFLAEALAPLDQRLGDLLSFEGVSAEEILRRVQLITQPRLPAGPVTFFPQCAEAVLRRRRLTIRYHSRSSDETTERELSPERLLVYRDNWYLDAWCHMRRDHRRFAVDRIQAARVLDLAAEEGQEEMHDDLPGFGIFSGLATNRAVLRFTSERARWVADEVWHPQQQGRLLPDGRYELELPYGEPVELVMEILKYGPDVEVVGPAALREMVRKRLQQTLQLY